MTFNELIELARAKPVVVQCKKLAEDWESYPEAGMRMVVTGGTINEEHDVSKLFVDFEPFDDFNKAFESSNYYDKSQRPVLNARDAGFYKLKDHIYVPPTESIEGYLELVEPAAAQLFNEYSALASPKLTYVGWLEELVLSQRTVPGTSQ